MAKSNRFIPSGLVGHWRFQGLSGSNRRGTIVDQSGNGNNGTIYGAPALSFDGTNDKAAVDTPWDALSGHRYAVIAVRVFVDADVANRALFDVQHNDAVNGKITYMISDTDKLKLLARAGGSGDSSTIFTSDSGLTENAWHSLLVQVDVEGDTMTFWDNGTLLASTGNAQEFSQDTFAADVPNVQVFGELAGGAYDLTGRMKWMGYGGLDTPVTITDAQQYYDNPQAWLSSSGLDAWYPCSEAAGAAVDNAEGTAGHDLTLTGATWDVTNPNGGNAYLQTGGSGDSFYSGGRWFDGVDDWIDVPDSAELRPGTGEFQIHVWAKCDSTQPNDNGVFIGKGKFGAGEWMFRLQLTGGEYRLSFYGDAGGIQIQEAAGNNRADDTLHLFSAIRTGTTVRIYIDTVLPTDGTDASAGDDLADAADMNIGSTNDETGRCLAADIYQVFYSKKTMSLNAGRAEMAAIYAQGAYA